MGILINKSITLYKENDAFFRLIIKHPQVRQVKPWHRFTDQQIEKHMIHKSRQRLRVNVMLPAPMLTDSVTSSPVRAFFLL